MGYDLVKTSWFKPTTLVAQGMRDKGRFIGPDLIGNSVDLMRAKIPAGQPAVVLQGMGYVAGNRDLLLLTGKHQKLAIGEKVEVITENPATPLYPSAYDTDLGEFQVRYEQ